MSEPLKKEDLHPTSYEFLNEFCADSDYQFLETFDRIFDDIASLKIKAYDENTNICETCLCLLRISELQSLNLNVRLPIILYLQDKQQFIRAYKHCLYAIQNLHFTPNDLSDTDNQTKLRMLYECQVENLYHLSKYEEVVQVSSEFINNYSNIPIISARIYHMSFFANVQLKQFKSALIDITKSIHLDPNNATLYNHRCYVYCEEGNFEIALEDADKCLSIDPNHEIGLNNRGSIYNDLKQYEKAIIDLDKAINLSKGKNANAFRHRSYSYYMLKKYDKAINDINKALEINQQYYDAKKLKLTMWNDHLKWIKNGIYTYCENNHILLVLPLIHVITDYVVGVKENIKQIECGNDDKKE